MRLVEISYFQKRMGNLSSMYSPAARADKREERKRKKGGSETKRAKMLGLQSLMQLLVVA
jgi:hypothetical protein